LLAGADLGRRGADADQAHDGSPAPTGTASRSRAYRAWS
jgi:hypothetical protein